jgi:hypothetical protein
MKNAPPRDYDKWTPRERRERAEQRERAAPPPIRNPCPQPPPVWPMPSLDQFPTLEPEPATVDMGCEPPKLWPMADEATAERIRKALLELDVQLHPMGWR